MSTRENIRLIARTPLHKNVNESMFTIIFFTQTLISFMMGN